MTRRLALLAAGRRRLAAAGARRRCRSEYRVKAAYPLQLRQVRRMAGARRPGPMTDLRRRPEPVRQPCSRTWSAARRCAGGRSTPASSSEPDAGCHVIFVPARRHCPRPICAPPRGTPTLTVGETDRLHRAGRHRSTSSSTAASVRFEINRDGRGTGEAAHQLAAAAAGADRGPARRRAMTAFRDLPIRRKLLLMTLASDARRRCSWPAAGSSPGTSSQLRREIERGRQRRRRASLAGNSGRRRSTFRTAGRRRRDAGRARESAARQARLPLRRRRDALRDVPARRRAAGCPRRPPRRRRFGWNTLRGRSRRSRIGNDRSRDASTCRAIWRTSRPAAASAPARRRPAGAGRRRRAGSSPAGCSGRSPSRCCDLADTARAISDQPRLLAPRRAHRPATKSAWSSTPSTTCSIASPSGRRSCRGPTPSCEREVEERRRVERERTAALERERDANRLKDEFLATLSHELRTPLNAVLGLGPACCARRASSRRRGARALESIERNARAQARLIEDLLEISRIVTGKLRLQVRDADLAAIVDAAVEIVQPAATAKRLQLDGADRRAAGDDGRRSGPAAAGGLEPAVERRQVHAGRRHGRRPPRAARTATA